MNTAQQKLTLILFGVWSVGLTLATSVQGQEAAPTAERDPSSKVSIDDMAWIVGDWEGDALGGKFQESWNTPLAGSMVGMFKHVKDGEVNFYEILTIVPQDDTFVLRLKHFHKDLVGWEEKDESVEFPLVSVSDKEIKFSGLVFRKISADNMKIEVLTESGKLEFDCQRRGVQIDSRAQQAIRRVFAMDLVLAKQRDHLTEKESLATSVQTYVAALDELNFAECPIEFVEAFKTHRDAWNQSLEFLAKHADLRGEMHELFDKIRALDDENATEIDRHFENIMDTWHVVENIAAEHGVK